VADISFAQAVDALYRVLDMPAPLRPELEGGLHRIVFESGDEPIEITLQLAPNGRTLVVKAADAPRFSEDASIRQEQIRQVLMTALGLSATNRACAGIAGGQDPLQPPGLSISASVSLSAPLSLVGAEMKAAVEDVMELVEWQGAHLKAGGNARKRAPSLPASGNHFANEDEFLVLRP
jgi:hypothetical protein